MDSQNSYIKKVKLKERKRKITFLSSGVLAALLVYFVFNYSPTERNNKLTPISVESSSPELSQVNLSTHNPIDSLSEEKHFKEIPEESISFSTEFTFSDTSLTTDPKPESQAISNKAPLVKNVSKSRVENNKLSTKQPKIAIAPPKKSSTQVVEHPVEIKKPKETTEIINETDQNPEFQNEISSSNQREEPVLVKTEQQSNSSAIQSPEFHPITNTKKGIDYNTPVKIADKMPSFPGGTKALYKFLKREISYPQMAIRHDIEGKVFVQFIVNKEGDLDQVKVVKGLGYGCDQEAIRVIQKMPQWIAGRMEENPIPVIFTIPVIFEIN